MATEARQLGLLEEVDLTKLEVHPRNPRTDVGDITELAASIAQIGVLEPIVGIRHNGKIQAITGSRRLAAARKAGLKQIPVRIMEMAEADAAAAALIENLQRKDLEPLEEAKGYQGWLELTGKTQVELAKAVGRAPSTIANTLRLLRAPEAIQEALRAKRVTPAHARVLLQLKDEAAFAKIDAKELPGMTVDELQQDVEMLNRNIKFAGAPAVAAAKSALADYLQKQAGDKNPPVITWRRGHSRDWDPIVDLVDALGKPPKSIAGVVGEALKGAKASVHQKGCGCSAYELTVDKPYGASELKFGVQRVCIDGKKYRTLAKNRNDYGYSQPSKSKPLSPADQEKLARSTRKKAEGAATKVLQVVKGDAQWTKLFTKIGKGQIPADVARALTFIAIADSEISDRIIRGYYGGDDMLRLVVWERLAKMPAKKLSAIAASFIARLLQEQIANLTDTSYQDDPTDADAAAEIAGHFGVKLAEPAKKKAKR